MLWYGDNNGIVFLFNLMNELRFTHGQDHNNFLKDVEWTGTEEYVEESMWFPVSSATLSCYIQNKEVQL